MKESNDVLVLVVFGAEEKVSHTLLKKLAADDDQVVYVISTSTDVTEDAAAVDEVVLFKKLDEGKVIYNGKVEKEALGEFAKPNSLTLVITFTKVKAPMIYECEKHYRARS